MHIAILTVADAEEINRLTGIELPVDGDKKEVMTPMKRVNGHWIDAKGTRLTKTFTERNPDIGNTVPFVCLDCGERFRLNIDGCPECGSQNVERLND